ncbi:RmlC-like cupin [Piedraia hortae CBS 480.64]|uniref:RmlC-like cupin n=1 Tax=Piedraia hortae CBS 480.64 TaxID=1314780 RepID=A0A6A7BWY5_9PEZI|nr:RmlC-like cupin [Piedraia hortae CBS 480.64]
MKTYISILVFAATIVTAIFYNQSTIDEFMQSYLGKGKSVLSRLPARYSSAMANSSFQGLPVIPSNDPSLNAVNPKPRGIRQVFEAVEQSEGAGAIVRRSIGTMKLRNLTPFLMLDHFFVSMGAGFPDHPHRGQETITYLLDGAVDHEDFAGNKGTIETGDLQFMTAGRGIVHAEMPRDDGKGSKNVGMQLWVDLPENLKKCEPRYRDLRASEIPQAKSPDGKVTVKVISGRSFGVDSLKELAYTPVWYLDVTIQPGGQMDQPLPSGWNSFAYVLEGTTTWTTGDTSRTVPQYHNVVFEQEGDMVRASLPADASKAARFVLVAGMPLNQPIVQYGPFVLTSPMEVRQAMIDFQSHSNGFERAKHWSSEIGQTMM